MKKEYHKDRKEKIKLEEEKSPEREDKDENNEIIKDYKENLMKYGSLKKQIPKGNSREAFTMQLLAKFQKKLEAAKEKKQDDTEGNEEKSEDAADDNDESW